MLHLLQNTVVNNAVPKLIDLLIDKLKAYGSKPEPASPPPSPPPRRPNKPNERDTVKLSLAQKHFVVRAHQDMVEFNKNRNKGEPRRTVKELTQELNQALGRKKSTSYYSAIWNNPPASGE